MALEIRMFEEHYLARAAELSATRYRRLCAQIPLLPACYGDSNALLPKLQEIRRAGPGVVALNGGQVVGFLAGWPLASLRGHPGVFCPEWACGADNDDGDRIYAAMYAHLAEEWALRGYSTHVVSLLAHDPVALEAWHWLGFGMAAADAVRGLEPIPHRAPIATVRRGDLGDVDALVQLGAELHTHLTQAPTFLPGSQAASQSDWLDFLRDPAKAVWLAFENGQTLAYLKLGPANDDASAIIYDEGTASITGAYTRPKARGGGIMTALLDRGLRWAREQGYVRCAVDFEPTNPPAARFWRRYFEPVCYSVMRRI